MMTDFKNKITSFVLQHKKIFLLFVSAIFTGIDNSFTAWFSYVTVYFLLDELSFSDAWLYGGLYGVFSAFYYAFWLFKFSIPAMLCIWILFFFFYALQFEALKAAGLCGKNISFILYILIPVLFEFLRTLGFSGFNYMIAGYTQYENLYLIQIARFTGVFGVSFLLYYSSTLIYECTSDYLKQQVGTRNLVHVIVFLVLVVSSIIYGFIEVTLLNSRDKKCPKIPVAAIQHNQDPKNAGIEQYKTDAENLILLTEEAFSENPDIKIVIWPETAVVPSILENYENEKSPSRKELVGKILNYIDSKKCTFIIGNFHSENGDDYNSVYVFEGGKNVIPPRPEVYRKNHLVPFSENLPFADKFPKIRDFLTRRNNFLWTPGEERTIFTYTDDENGGVELKFCTPVCFEDTFGRDVRKFYRKGARAIFSLGNDSWSRSKTCQEQHLKMAVFRSVENRIPSVRSTASGETCIISSCGKILKRSEPFKKNYVTGEISIIRN